MCIVYTVGIYHNGFVEGARNRITLGYARVREVHDNIDQTRSSCCHFSFTERNAVQSSKIINFTSLSVEKTLCQKECLQNAVLL